MIDKALELNWLYTVGLCLCELKLESSEWRVFLFCREPHIGSARYQWRVHVYLRLDNIFGHAMNFGTYAEADEWLRSNGYL